jgi:molybdopterin-guanine dinucleotide biosynthesis protein A
VPFDAVVLAGGRGSRLGGATKPEVLVAGRALVDHVLDGVRRARRVVLVAPASVARPGVPTVLEDPPGGGPVAGLAAGLAALADAAPSERRAGAAGDADPGGPAGDGFAAAEVVVVLACDVPRAGSAVPALVAAATVPGVDGARLVAADGSAQPLVAAYRRAPLAAALAALPSTHGVSMRRALAGLHLADVPDPDHASLDADTWDDVARLRRAPWWHDREDAPKTERADGHPADPPHRPTEPTDPTDPTDPPDPTAGA